jgi:hypothetical protein
MNNSIHTTTHDFKPFARSARTNDDYVKHILD